MIRFFFLKRIEKRERMVHWYMCLQIMHFEVCYMKQSLNNFLSLYNRVDHISLYSVPGFPLFWDFSSRKDERKWNFRRIAINATVCAYPVCFCHTNRHEFMDKVPWYYSLRQIFFRVFFQFNCFLQSIYPVSGIANLPGASNIVILHVVLKK